MKEKSRVQVLDFLFPALFAIVIGSIIGFIISPIFGLVFSTTGFLSIFGSIYFTTANSMVIFGIEEMYEARKENIKPKAKNGIWLIVTSVVWPIIILWLLGILSAEIVIYIQEWFAWYQN